MNIISVSNGQATTTSLAIADSFGKRHTHVLRAISNLECSREFAKLNFGLSDYVDSTGRIAA